MFLLNSAVLSCLLFYFTQTSNILCQVPCMLTTWVPSTNFIPNSHLKLFNFKMLIMINTHTIFFIIIYYSNKKKLHSRRKLKAESNSFKNGKNRLCVHTAFWQLVCIISQLVWQSALTECWKKQLSSKRKNKYHQYNSECQKAQIWFRHRHLGLENKTK